MTHTGRNKNYKFWIFVIVVVAALICWLIYDMIKINN